MGNTVRKNIENQWKDFDGTRLYHKSLQQQEKTKIKIKKLKQKKSKSEKACKKGILHKSGEFHISGKLISFRVTLIFKKYQL